LGTASGDLDALEAQLLLDPHRPVAGRDEGVIERVLFDLGRDPVGMGSFGAGQAVDQPFGALGLEVATDFVELLAKIANQLALAADIDELGGKF
jgi:hypothetical protein